MQKAVFLDKDGTLVYNFHYSVKPGLIRLTAGAVPGLKKLKNAGYSFIVVSNQQGISLGYFLETDLIPVRNTLNALLRKEGLKLSGFYYCPHKADDNCLCRKPKPGMLQKAAAEHNIDLKSSWMIGDVPADIEAGKRVGCRTVFLDTGNESNEKFTEASWPDFVARSLNEAAKVILLNQTYD